MQNLKAKDIMQPEETVTYLTLNSTYGEAKEFTKAGRFCNYNFPLVENSGKYSICKIYINIHVFIILDFR